MASYASDWEPRWPKERKGVLNLSQITVLKKGNMSDLADSQGGIHRRNPKRAETKRKLCEATNFNLLETFHAKYCTQLSRHDRARVNSKCRSTWSVANRAETRLLQHRQEGRSQIGFSIIISYINRLESQHGPWTQCAINDPGVLQCGP